MALPSSSHDPATVSDPTALFGHCLVGRYEITGLLGEGGIGRVYRARHIALEREVAVKVLLDRFRLVPELTRRFEREARALAALSHPNIVTITDFGVTEEATFLVMELVEGENLEDLMERGAVPTDQVFAIFEQVLNSLAYAHALEVVHRDLKPQNIMISRLPAERVHAVVLDFGLAKFMDDSGPSPNLTQSGLIVGTPAYMAPEQASGGHSDQRADVYAAGIILYELLAGTHPFDDTDPSELLRQHLLVPPPSLASQCPDTEVDPALEAFIQRALAKETGQRFRDGGDMLDAFGALAPDMFVRRARTWGRKAKVRGDAPTELGSEAVEQERRRVAAARATAPQELPRRKRGYRGWWAAALLLLAGAGYAYVRYWPRPAGPKSVVVTELGAAPPKETSAGAAPASQPATREPSPERNDGTPDAPSETEASASSASAAAAAAAVARKAAPTRRARSRPARNRRSARARAAARRRAATKHRRSKRRRTKNRRKR